MQIDMCTWVGPSCGMCKFRCASEQAARNLRNAVWKNETQRNSLEHGPVPCPAPPYKVPTVPMCHLGLKTLKIFEIKFSHWQGWYDNKPIHSMRPRWPLCVEPGPHFFIHLTICLISTSLETRNKGEGPEGHTPGNHGHACTNRTTVASTLKRNQYNFLICRIGHVVLWLRAGYHSDLKAKACMQFNLPLHCKIGLFFVDESKLSMLNLPPRACHSHCHCHSPPRCSLCSHLLPSRSTLFFQKKINRKIETKSFLCHFRSNKKVFQKEFWHWQPASCGTFVHRGKIEPRNLQFWLTCRAKSKGPRSKRKTNNQQPNVFR